VIKIKVKGKRSTEASERPPPGTRENTTIHAVGQPSPPMPVYVHEEILSDMCAWGIEGQRLEVGGFILGGLHTYRSQRYLDIRAQIPSLQAESAAAHLAFTNEAQRECYEIKDRQYPGESVLGWYHTHPTHGVFLSGYDLFIHKQFFTLDWHIAIVIDPMASPPERDAGVFLWQGSQISRAYGMTVYR
jgi:proteasome lid subunit RPN8/RPN11